MVLHFLQLTIRIERRRPTEELTMEQWSRYEQKRVFRRRNEEKSWQHTHLIQL